MARHTILLIIDNGCMPRVRNPTRFDVLLMENLYGDLIGDVPP